jgi:hypothetical protein
MSDVVESSVIQYYCETCRRRFYGPAGEGLIGVRYLGNLYAFQSARVGCPICGGAVLESGGQAYSAVAALA